MRQEEEHVILSERLEDQQKTVAWVQREYEKIIIKKGEKIADRLMAEMTPKILAQKNKGKK